MPTIELFTTLTALSSIVTMQATGACVDSFLCVSISNITVKDRSDVLIFEASYSSPTDIMRTSYKEGAEYSAVYVGIKDKVSKFLTQCRRLDYVLLPFAVSGCSTVLLG